MCPPELSGVGVDVVAWSRIRRFLESHAFEFLKRLLTPAEQSAFRKSRSALQFFARVFAAKEAYFKAAGDPGMDEARFREIETRPGPGNHFVVGETKKNRWGKGIFFETADGLGARVLIWEKGGFHELDLA